MMNNTRNKKNAIAENLVVSIPQEVENLQLPNPELLLYYQNLSNRTIWLDSDVDNMWLEYEKQIIQWNREDIGKPIEERKPIKLMFFSYGGDVDINWSFIDLIKKSETPVWGINMGRACSAACFIFISCHKRFAMPRATFLIHRGSGRFEGTFDVVITSMQEYQNSINELGSYIIEHTKITKKTLNKYFATEWYLNSKEALKYGVVDEVVEKLSDIL